MFISNFYKHIHGKYETRIFIAYITALSIMCVCVCARMHAYVCALGCIKFFVTPMECRAPGPSVHRIFQARYWSELPFSASRDLPFLTQGSNQCLLCLLHWQTDSLPLHHLGSPDQGSNQDQSIGSGVLATGPPGKSLLQCNLNKFIHQWSLSEPSVKE